MKDALRVAFGPAALVVAALAAVLCATAPAAERLAAENAWVPWAPSSIKVHAAYMTIVNPGNADQVIIGAESPDYERVELHGTSIENGLSKMRSFDRIAVPAHKRVAFEPGGLHFMLTNPRRPYAADDRIRLVLRLDGGDRVEVEAVVRRRTRDDTGHHRHHGSHH